MLNGPLSDFHKPTAWINYILEIRLFHLHVHFHIYKAMSERTQDTQMFVITGKKNNNNTDFMLVWKEKKGL